MSELPTNNYQLPTKENLKIFLATDHAGFEYKEHIKSMLIDSGEYEVVDVGAHSLDLDDDYPAFMHLAASKVSEDPENTKAIILGGSGQGEAMVVNKYPGVRAVVYYGEPASVDSSELIVDSNADMNKENIKDSAYSIIALSRLHNDANVLSLGARFLTLDEAKRAVQLWLSTEFSGDARHTRRINDIDIKGSLAIFDKWNVIKKETEKAQKKHYYREGEVFFARMGKNIGFEQDGKGGDFLRPVLVLKRYNKDIFTAVPLTTKEHTNKYYYELGQIGERMNYAILSQARLMDARRLEYKIGSIKYASLIKVRKALVNLLL